MTNNTYTEEFAAALKKVAHDVEIDAGRGADLVAVGVDRNDCLNLLLDCTEGVDFAIGSAVAVQAAVAVGVWIERARWENNELPDQNKMNGE